MPNQFGGDQLDPDYAPHMSLKLNPEESKVIAEIVSKRKYVGTLDEQIGALNERKKKLLEEIAKLQKKCRHRNTISSRGAYGIVRQNCMDCGAMVSRGFV